MTQHDQLYRLDVLLDTPDEHAAQVLECGLSGIAQISRATAASLLAVRRPIDLIVIARADLGGDVLDTVGAVNKAYGCPIVMFVDACDPAQINAAIDSGISALVVDGLKAERIPFLVELARARFRNERHLRAELERARSELVARKAIERAKGILMERKKLSEEEAYRVLRRSAMNDGKTIADIANAIMTADRLWAV